jgi:hypothetical protein
LTRVKLPFFCKPTAISKNIVDKPRQPAQPGPFEQSCSFARLCYVKVIKTLQAIQQPRCTGRW